MELSSFVEDVVLRKIISILLFGFFVLLFGAGGVSSDEVDVKNHIAYEKSSAKKAEGIYRYYYDSGTLRQEANYRDGVLNGVFREYRRNGSIRLEVTYKDGKAISGRTYRADGRKEKELNRLDFAEMSIEC